MRSTLRALTRRATEHVRRVGQTFSIMTDLYFLVHQDGSLQALKNTQHILWHLENLWLGRIDRLLWREDEDSVYEFTPSDMVSSDGVPMLACVNRTTGKKSFLMVRNDMSMTLLLRRFCPPSQTFSFQIPKPSPPSECGGEECECSYHAGDPTLTELMRVWMNVPEVDDSDGRPPFYATAIVSSDLMKQVVAHAGQMATAQLNVVGSTSMLFAYLRLHFQMTQDTITVPLGYTRTALERSELTRLRDEPR